MSLKKQLVIIFGALAFVVLVVGGITFWTFVQWRSTSTEIRVHYLRNLLLEQIRSNMYRAFKEVPDAVTGDDPDSREEFVSFLKPAEEDFKSWSELPNNAKELEEYKTVRIAYDSLVQAAFHAFDLVEAGRKKEASVFMESNLEDKNFAYFQKVTDAVAASDRHKSTMVKLKMQKAQSNAQIVLVITALGAIALILLLSAYISSDLFKPLREVESALENAANGDLRTRLDEERNDEIGRIYSAFNHLVAVIGRREKLAAIKLPGILPVGTATSVLPEIAPELTMHAVLAQVRDKIGQLKNKPEMLVEKAEKENLLNELNHLVQMLEQMVAFGYPQPLKISKTDISQLLYEVLLQFKDELAKRSVSLEFDLDPLIDQAFVDKLKLREAIGALVKNAMLYLPESGGKIGVRTRLMKESSRLFIEIADNGRSSNVIDNKKQPIGEPESIDLNLTGVNLAREIVKQHVGQLKEINDPEQGNYVRIELPYITAD